MKKCCHRHSLALPVRVALCLGLGAALAASNDLATGVAVAGGLFIALLPRPEDRP